MNYKISHVVRTGRRHQAEGIPCQDQIHVCREGGVVCAALADGAGSRASSHIGAACVTAAVAALACEEFEGWWAQEDRKLAARILRRCLEELEGQPYPVYELASTLLFFAADGAGRYLSGHLGDGGDVNSSGVNALQIGAEHVQPVGAGATAIGIGQTVSHGPAGCLGNALGLENLGDIGANFI